MFTETRITNLNEIINYMNIPWMFWKDLLERRDKLTLLSIADWLTERDDELHAAAWRDIYNNDFEPLQAGSLNYYWFKNIPVFNSSFKTYKSIPNHHKSVIGEDLYTYLCVIERYQYNIKRKIYIPQYQTITSGCGRADTFDYLAKAITLYLSGFKPMVFTDAEQFINAG